MAPAFNQRLNARPESSVKSRDEDIGNRMVGTRTRPLLQLEPGPYPGICHVPGSGKGVSSPALGAKKFIPRPMQRGLSTRCQNELSSSRPDSSLNRGHHRRQIMTIDGSWVIRFDSRGRPTAICERGTDGANGRSGCGHNSTMMGLQ